MIATKETILLVFCKQYVKSFYFFRNMLELIDYKQELRNVKK